MISANSLRIAPQRLGSFQFLSHRSTLSPTHGICNPKKYSGTAKYSDKLLIYNSLPLRPQAKQAWICRYLSDASPTHPLRRTGLYDLHVEHEATIVPFGGYSMPLQYTDLTISQSHHWTRKKASLFDVGHMYDATSIYANLA